MTTWKSDGAFGVDLVELVYDVDSVRIGFSKALTSN